MDNKCNILVVAHDPSDGQTFVNMSCDIMEMALLIATVMKADEDMRNVIVAANKMYRELGEEIVAKA